MRAWVEANLPEGIEADVHCPPGGVAPCSSDLDCPAMDALLSAIAQAFDTEPDEVLFTREGGSGPEADLVEHPGRARCSSSAPGCPPTASTRRTSGSCCRCSTAARRRRRTCGASSAAVRF